MDNGTVVQAALPRTTAGWTATTTSPLRTAPSGSRCSHPARGARAQRPLRAAPAWGLAVHGDDQYLRPPGWAEASRRSATFQTRQTARCYTYRVFETVVPLRNMIWRQG